MTTECQPILCKHPMLKALEELSCDATRRRSVIDGIRAGGEAAERLTRIERDGLMERYETDTAKRRARQQLLDGPWGDASKLLQISDAVRRAFEAVEAKEKPLVAWWAPGATRQEILPLIAEGAEAIYLILLTRSLESPIVMAKAYDAEFLDDLRRQTVELALFFERH